MSIIGNNIQRLRNNNGWTQDQLARKMNCSKQTISNYETGRREPDLSTINELAKVLNVSPSEIISDERQPTILAGPDMQSLNQRVAELIEDEINSRVNEKMKELQEPEDPDEWIPLAPGFYNMPLELQKSFKDSVKNIWKAYHSLSTQQRKDDAG